MYGFNQVPLNVRIDIGQEHVFYPFLRLGDRGPESRKYTQMGIQGVCGIQVSLVLSFPSKGVAIDYRKSVQVYAFITQEFDMLFGEIPTHHCHDVYTGKKPRGHGKMRAASAKNILVSAKRGLDRIQRYCTKYDYAHHALLS
jgi:hypothetical protein